MNDEPNVLCKLKGISQSFAACWIVRLNVRIWETRSARRVAVIQVSAMYVR